MFRVFNFCVFFALLWRKSRVFCNTLSHTTRHNKNSTMSSALRRTIRGRIKRVFFSRCHILVVSSSCCLVFLSSSSSSSFDDDDDEDRISD